MVEPRVATSGSPRSCDLHGPDGVEELPDNDHPQRDVCGTYVLYKTWCSTLSQSAVPRNMGDIARILEDQLQAL
ncbi:hypothetical protein GN958_ATG12467 [Phytophthora infestans]|uniref:Uncharacterized protein n=1 Tax=Phytophthora infestans TaxID=4787 RepID=A0A8S9UCT1_PHYIN|nr:hypothetical protein GN958_ATG12467 [Phytophthora infestans]